MSRHMTEAIDVLVVGAGIAGVAAACALADNGWQVRLIDQAPTLGGAVLRQPMHGSDHRLHGPHQIRWAQLQAHLLALEKRITINLGCQFGGVDANGMALLVHTLKRSHEILTPRAVVLALGATERVRPRLGWELPGVSSAGAIQILLKTSLKAPNGRIVLAGSGPLLLAVAAQLTRMNAPPLAVLEAANPFGKWRHALGLPWNYLREAAGYALTLARAGVQVYTNTELVSVRQKGAVLSLQVRSPLAERYIETDWLGLHDGLAPNHYGPLPSKHLILRKTGDGNEVLGARAAAADGELVGHEVSGLLTQAYGQASPSGSVKTINLKRCIAVEARAQGLLNQIFQVETSQALAKLPDDTVICRCENRRLADLKALGPAPTARELRLLGRFAMGGCQGRFCSHWVEQIVGAEKKNHASILSGAHWPSRPMSIEALVTPLEDIQNSTFSKI